jgi:hypothetical protein
MVRSTPAGFTAHLTRACWLVMLVLHGWILIRSWTGGAASFNSQFLLIGSNLFFLAKLIDPPILRVRPGRQALVAGVLVVALLHVGAIDRALGLGAEPLVWMQVGASAAALVTISLMPTRLFRRFAESLAAVRGECEARIVRACNWQADEVRRRHRRLLAVSSIISRPPPTC